MKNSLKGYMLSNEELLLLKGGDNGQTTVYCKSGNTIIACYQASTCTEASSVCDNVVGVTSAVFSCGNSFSCPVIDFIQ